MRYIIIILTILAIFFTLFEVKREFSCRETFSKDGYKEGICSYEYKFNKRLNIQ